MKNQKIKVRSFAIMTAAMISIAVAGIVNCIDPKSSPNCGSTVDKPCKTVSATICPGSVRCRPEGGSYTTVAHPPQSKCNGPKSKKDCLESPEICEEIDKGTCNTQTTGECYLDIEGKPLGVGITSGVKKNIYECWDNPPPGSPQIKSGGTIATSF